MRNVTLWAWPLPLDFERLYSAVAWSNSVPNFSEIEQSAAQLLCDFHMFTLGAVPNLGFDGRWKVRISCGP